MPTLTGPGIDPTLAGPADVFVSGTDLGMPIPPAPEPGPDWEAGSGLPLFQVVLGRAVKREVIGELTTADLDDWCDEVELLAGTAGTIAASSWDPLWEACAETVTMGADGEPKYTFDPGGFVVWVYEDSACVWTGRFAEPVSIGGGRVVLPAQGPESVFNERILGRPEQLDLLGDRGSFEGYANEAEMVADGWVFPAGMLYELVADGVSGVQCLRVKGGGWFRSPKATVQGGSISKAVQGSAFGKWSDAVPVGQPVIRTRVQRTDSLAPSNEDVGFANLGERPDSGEYWSDGPIKSATRTTPQAITHRAWVECTGWPGHWTSYDVITIRESVQTGFPPGSERDLSYYVERIHRDLVSRNLGGSPTGLKTTVKSLTGVETSQRWEHSRRQFVREILAVVLDADGGPECKITPGWNLEIHGAGLGSERDDIALSVHDILEPGWQVDPGARVQDFAVDTGRGSGALALIAVVSQPFEDDQWRRYAEVLGPVDRTLNEIESWTRAHARVAARIQATAEVEVPWHVAKQIVCGDVLWVSQHDGAVAAPTVRMRVLRIRWNAKRYTATLTLGAHDG